MALNNYFAAAQQHRAHNMRARKAVYYRVGAVDLSEISLGVGLPIGWVDAGLLGCVVPA